MKQQHPSYQDLSIYHSEYLQNASHFLLISFFTRAFTVLAPGLETTIQDLPGRTVGLGVPISGPMDPVAFKLANILVGNNQDVEGLEVILVSGMELALQFHTRAAVAVTGKDVEVELELDGKVEACNMWKVIMVPKDGILRMQIKDAVTGGLRNYIAVHGGLPEIPKYLGSKSTSFGLGGYQVISEVH